MSARLGTVIQPPETQNVFLCFSIVVGLLWAFRSTRRCWAVVQLRRSLGARRLVAIRGAGRRVRIFRLLGRHYLQRALGRNHLQALVHTRQAYPPKVMPSSLLLVSDPLSGGGVKAILHPQERGGGVPQPLPPHPPSSHDAATAATAATSATSTAKAGGIVRADVEEEAGPLVGVSVALDCRVACTVELLWDVDIALLGLEMGLHPKQHLLPASTGPRGARVGARGNGGSAGDSYSAGDRPPNSNRGHAQGTSDGMMDFSSLTRDAWDWMVSLSRRLAHTGTGGGTGRVMGGWDNRSVGTPPESSSPPSVSLQQQWADWRSGGGIRDGDGGDGVGGNGYFEGVAGDEEMGARREGLERSRGTSPPSPPPLAADRNGGAGGGGGRSWAASIGLRKSAAVSNEGAIGGRRASVEATGLGSEGSGGGRGGGREWGPGGPGGVSRGSMGLCRKRTVPRSLAAGRCRVFETLPGESYFRGRPRRGVWARTVIPTVDPGLEGAGGALGDGGRRGSRSAAAAAAARAETSGGSAGGATAAGRTAAAAAAARTRRGDYWPRVGDSVRSGRCSLAIVIRPAAAEEAIEAASVSSSWRHRPTHHVTRQVLLVQLTDTTPDGSGAAPQRAPAARCLRHLVAISNSGGGGAGVANTESVYSFSEVFGDSSETGGLAGPLLDPASGADASVHGAVDGLTNGTVGSGGGNPPQQNQQSVATAEAPGGGGEGGEGGEEDSEEAECVICLTDPKDTLLLPCRHLCVCTECFRHVDKCPVCRAGFDNYIVLSGTPPSPQQ